MSGCVGDCPLEAVQQDARSAGAVEGDEQICRGAYDPLHFKKAILQTSIVKGKDLYEGTLSVWRASEKANFSLADVFAICEQSGPPKQTLTQKIGRAHV